MSDTEAWYVVKQANGQCVILSGNDVEPLQKTEESSASEHWGPYDSQQEAIARRVGLIRAGKCQPA
ncbi:MAG: hypothetical protein KME42_18760 [Tildeniella nuda ZEHNDER 1965/U140]|nr:hypothetical protein [Tildeniella nuda ZEHNDER 1965/U140]